MEQSARQSNQIILQNREILELTDVKDVGNFDESTVAVVTSLGDLTVRGHNLQVQRLDLESGNLTIEGKVDSLAYSEPSKGLFGRLLR